MLKAVTPGLHFFRGIIGTNNKVAAFDLDWTLIRPIHGRFSRDEHDWSFLPHRITILKTYVDAGYTIAIFTNQGFKGVKVFQAINRISLVIQTLISEGITPYVYAATGPDSQFRKPSPNMWNQFVRDVRQEGLLNITEAFYVGDAAGRPHDFSSADRDFARAVDILFYTPEEIFPNNSVVIPDTQTMFIFVGMPGSGKSTFFRDNLQQLGWTSVNQDILKTKSRMLSTTRTALQAGQSVAIDATNPTVEGRRQYINMAAEYQIPTLIIYFVSNGHERNKLRADPVPTVAYNVYYKNLVEPTAELDRVPVVQLT